MPRIRPGAVLYNHGCNNNLQELFVHNLFNINVLLNCSVFLDLDFQSFFAGVAASGAITAALRFFTKAVFENSRDGLRKGASMWQQSDLHLPHDL